MTNPECTVCRLVTEKACRQGLVMVPSPCAEDSWLVVSIYKELKCCHNAPGGLHVWLGGQVVYSGTEDDVIVWLCQQTEGLPGRLCRHLRG